MYLYVMFSKYIYSTTHRYLKYKNGLNKFNNLKNLNSKILKPAGFLTFNSDYKSNRENGLFVQANKI